MRGCAPSPFRASLSKSSPSRPDSLIRRSRLALAICEVVFASPATARPRRMNRAPEWNPSSGEIANLARPPAASADRADRLRRHFPVSPWPGATNKVSSTPASGPAAGEPTAYAGRPSDPLFDSTRSPRVASAPRKSFGTDREARFHLPAIAAHVDSMGRTFSVRPATGAPVAHSRRRTRLIDKDNHARDTVPLPICTL